MNNRKMLMWFIVLGVTLLFPEIEADSIKGVPEVIITSPFSGTIFSKGAIVPIVVEYKASSLSADRQKGRTVNQLELLVDDEARGLLEIIAPPKESGNSTFSLDTLSISTGERTVKVIAQESGSGKGEASIKIRIESTTGKVALERLSINYGKIQDMQGSYTDSAMIGDQNKSPVHREVWLKPPDKSKIVSPEGTLITDGSKVTIIRPGKEPQEIDSSDYFPTTTATQMDFIYHRDEFMEKHEVNILNETDGLVEIEAIPKDREALYSRMKLRIDLNAGIEKETEVYDKEGNLIDKVEVLSYRKVGDVNLPDEKKETYYLDEGTIVNTTRLGEARLNTGISDDEFNP